MRKLVATAVAALVMIGAAACGGGGEEGSSAATTSEPAAVVEVAKPIVETATCSELSPTELRMEGSVANPGDAVTLYQFTPTMRRAGGGEFFARSVAVILPPQTSTPLIAGFPTRGNEPDGEDACTFSAHDLDEFAPNGGIPLADVVPDADLLASLTRAAVNKEACTDNENAQCADDVVCTPAAAGSLSGECEIYFLDEGSRDTNLAGVVFAVRFGPYGSFTYDYLSDIE